MTLARSSSADFPSDGIDRAVAAASKILQAATTRDEVAAASLFVQRGQQVAQQAFGDADSADAIFLIASISKPISVAAVMSLFDQGLFRLQDPLQTFLPEFRGAGRERVTIGQLLRHSSGLPDQLPHNESLRKKHAPLDEFVKGAIRTPLLFPPDSDYHYSSMGILLASEVAQRISGKPFSELVQETVFEPLGMTRSALGLGAFTLEQTMRCQVENAAPESGAGSAESQSWDWNSSYWRHLATPWGGVHASAPDVGRFLDAFLHPSEKWLRTESIRMMVTNQNPNGRTPRALGFGIGSQIASPLCSAETFGHSGATGTLAWADPVQNTTCVVLTTLPGRAANPHPRQLASDEIALGMASDQR